MTLPGKITVAFLEEDIPQKTFFRIKPLFIKDDGPFADAGDMAEQYPDEGGIRIVPDRNEAVRFKSRMRSNGRYCLVDLKKRAGESEKIRPNKNYNPENGENNRFIVYSDAVAACPEGLVIEVITPLEDAGMLTAPESPAIGTPFVALDINGEVTGPYRHTIKDGGYVFEPAIGFTSFSLTADSAQIHSYQLSDGVKLRVLVSDDMLPLYTRVKPEIAVETKAELKPEAKFEAKPETKSEVKPEAKPEAKPETKSEVKPEAKPEIKSETKSEVITEAKAETMPERISAAKTKDNPEAKAEAEPEIKPEIKPEAKPELKSEIKPETKSEAKPAPKQEPRPEFKPEPHPPRGEFTGLNPRRVKSLSEIIDEGWRRSRLEALGTPVPGNAGGVPAANPVEAAASALKEAWKHKDARESIIEEITKIDEIAEAVGAIAPKQKREERRNELDDLEAERLKLLGEIDGLRRSRLEKREELMNEVRQIHEKEIEKLENDINRLKTEKENSLRMAESAKITHDEAAKLFNAQSRKALEGDFLKFALSTRAAEILRGENGICDEDFAARPDLYEPNAAQLVSDVRRSFENSGRALSQQQAAELLCALAAGSLTLISGAPGCGKSDTAKALAGALGLTTPGANRFVRLDSGVKNALGDAGFKALMRSGNGCTLKFVLLDDINAYPCPDQMRGLMPYTENSRGGQLKLIATLQDDQIGYPAQPRLLDRAFMVRLESKPVRGRVRENPLPMVSRTPAIEAFNKAFDINAELPREIECRLDALLDALEELNLRVTRRTLNDVYAFCACAMPLMGVSPAKVLDRALCMRVLPYLMAVCPEKSLKGLYAAFEKFESCRELFDCPLPLLPM